MKRIPTPSPAALGRIAIGALIGFSCLLCLGCIHAPKAQTDATPKPAQSFPNGVLVRGCTQEDVPAFEMYFTQDTYTGIGDPTAPFLHFEIGSAPTEAFAPTTLALEDMNVRPRKPGRIVRARYVTAPGSSLWLRGTVVLDELVPGDHVSGHYNVTTPAGQRYQDSFRLKFTPTNAVCG